MILTTVTQLNRSMVGREKNDAMRKHTVCTGKKKTILSAILASSRWPTNV